MANDFYLLLSKTSIVFIGIIITIPIFCGFFGFFLPSFNYLPILGKGEISLSYFYMSMNIPGIYKSIILSIFTGLISTALALFFSQVILLYFFKTKFYNYIKIIISPLIALPHITMAIGLIFLLSPSGLLLRSVSPWFTGFDRPPNTYIFPDEYGFVLILGLMLKEIPFLILVSLSALREFSSTKFFDLGKSFQHSSFSTWFILIFPIIYKKIRLVVFIIIAFSSSVVDMSLLLAPSTPSTLSVRILQIFQSSDTESFFLASNLSLIQLLLIFTLFIFWIVLEKIIKQEYFYFFFIKISSLKLDFLKFVNLCFGIILFLLSFMGIICSILWGFSENWYFPNFFPNSLNLDSFLSFYDQNKSLILISIFIPLMVSFLSSTLTIIWVELLDYLKIKKTQFEWIIFIPLFIPQISFLIGMQSFIIFFNFNSFFIPLIFVQLFYVIPYCFIILAPAIREVKSDYIKVASSLGKNRIERLFKIKIPLILPSFLTSFSIGVIVSFSLYVPVYFIGAGRVTTLTVEALNLALSGSKQDLGIATFFQILFPILLLLTIALINRKTRKWKI
tara:strand:+ start:202 stop:1887 length:1686 start_codon:yes stop_codon:yes gene_type:complete